MLLPALVALAVLLENNYFKPKPVLIITAVRFGFESQQGQNINLFSKTLNTAFGAHRAFYLMHTGDSVQGCSGRNVWLTTSLRLVLRLRMSGVVPPLSLH